jgi:hypothetical protein
MTTPTLTATATRPVAITPERAGIRVRSTSAIDVN